MQAGTAAAQTVASVIPRRAGLTMNQVTISRRTLWLLILALLFMGAYIVSLHIQLHYAKEATRSAEQEYLYQEIKALKESWEKLHELDMRREPKRGEGP
jgi:hypothetical protein